MKGAQSSIKPPPAWSTSAVMTSSWWGTPGGGGGSCSAQHTAPWGGKTTRRVQSDFGSSGFLLQERSDVQDTGGEDGDAEGK